MICTVYEMTYLNNNMLNFYDMLAEDRINQMTLNFFDNTDIADIEYAKKVKSYFKHVTFRLMKINKTNAKKILREVQTFNTLELHMIDIAEEYQVRWENYYFIENTYVQFLNLLY